MPVAFVEKYGRKSASLVLGRDPGAVVGDDDARRAAPPAARRVSDRDLAGAAHRLDRVVDEVQDGPLDLVGVDLERRQVRGEIGADGRAPGCDSR